MLSRDWRTSTRSGTNGQCVEVRLGDEGGVQVRDTKNREGGMLTVSPAAWQSLTDAIKAGEFDLA